MQISKVNLGYVKLPRRKRVAAYARVSSGKDAMLHSLSAQVSYFSGFIQKHLDWEYVGVYADEAVTGTKDSRQEFQRMLSDCRAGKIDMVIVKGISRFARNTLTLLQTVRELKALGIDVFFQKENLYTLSAAGELMLTVLASFAQEESVSNSNNKKWQVRRDFKKGLCNWLKVYGYKRENGQLCIYEEEAAVVKLIFTDYYNGMGRAAIVKKLRALQVPTRDNTVWRENTIAYILSNEKYRGDMLLQKSYTLDPISKKKCFNRGELPKYYVSNSHDYIIEPQMFDAVQEMRKQRREKFYPIPQEQCTYPFSAMLYCKKCGARYRRRLTSKGTKYTKPVWICSTFFSYGKDNCASKQIPESTLMDTTAQVLGVEQFDEALLGELVDHIDITGPNSLLYVFTDGREVPAVWKDHSRRDSWTDEMKQAAREKQREYEKKTRRASNDE